ncbi:hypothetical protein ACTJJ4_11590 [Microbacterium sp. 22195]
MRLRNVNTKVVVVVRGGHPFTTDSDWEAVEAPKSRTKKTGSASD